MAGAAVLVVEVFTVLGAVAGLEAAAVLLRSVVVAAELVLMAVGEALLWTVVRLLAAVVLLGVVVVVTAERAVCALVVWELVAVLEELLELLPQLASANVARIATSRGAAISRAPSRRRRVGSEAWRLRFIGTVLLSFAE